MSRSLIPNGKPLDQQGNWLPSWLQVFTLWGAVATAAREYGATTDRPTSGLWIGRQFYDTTLGYPVFVHSVGPVVWHNAAGAVV
jgi:hypothetical protein